MPAGRPYVFVALAVVLAACAAEVEPRPEPSVASTDDAAPVTDPPATEPPLAPVGCTSGCAIVDVMAGLTHSCALRENGTVVCWGGNAEGQLGDDRRRHGDCSDAGDTEARDCAERPVEVVGLGDVATVGSRGALSTCTVGRGGDVHCWGLESVPLARGREQRRERHAPERVDGLRDVVDLSDGFDHACAVDGAGTLRCFGLNDRGQLGVGDTMERHEVVAVDLPAVRDVEVAVMRGFTCALTDAGAYCWGDNAHGQLADGRHDHDRCDDGLATVDCAFTPVRAPGLDEAVELSLGALHGCALDSDGGVACWGDGAAGQLGVPDGAAGRSEPAAVPDLDDIVQVSAGGLHTCALRADGRVLCWGANDEGQLGDGRLVHGDPCRLGADVFDCARTPAVVVGLDDATLVSAGAKHTCALRATGDVVCWGWSADRQLGDGDRHRDAAPVTVDGL